jgi:hypothetical protein
MKYLLGIFFILCSSFAFATSSIEQQCTLKPSQLGPVATKILRNYRKAGLNYPGSSVIRSDMEVNFTNQEGGNQITATYEAFVRIEKNGRFSAIPIPLITVDLSRERDIVYICAHVEPDTKKNFFVVYFLTGYNLGKFSFRSMLGDFFFNSVKVSPVTFSPISFDMVEGALEGLQKYLPFKIIFFPIKTGLELASQAQRLMMSPLKKIFPIGVERIVMTDTEVILSTGVNLQSPKESTVDYRINLKD